MSAAANCRVCRHPSRKHGSAGCTAEDGYCFCVLTAEALAAGEQPTAAVVPQPEPAPLAPVAVPIPSPIMEVERAAAPSVELSELAAAAPGPGLDRETAPASAAAAVVAVAATRVKARRRATAAESAPAVRDAVQRVDAVLGGVPAVTLLASRGSWWCVACGNGQNRPGDCCGVPLIAVRVEVHRRLS